MQIRSDAAIAIAGSGKLEPNIEQVMKYKTVMKAPLYVIALEERKYNTIFPE